MTGSRDPLRRRAAVTELLALLESDGATVATAESVSGGGLVASMTSVPGSSAVVRGSVVAYATDVKASVLGVDSAVLGEQGPVCAEVAEQMARGVRDLLNSTYGVSTTGEAGPDSASGRPVGTVFVAVASSRGTMTRRLELSGGRDQVQEGAVEGALSLLSRAREAARAAAGPGPAILPGNNRD